MKFVDVFQFFNHLLEEMSRCNCFSLQLVGGRLVGRTLEPKGEVCLSASSVTKKVLKPFNTELLIHALGIVA